MKLGLLTIERYQALKSEGVCLRVLVNGVDVTKHCRAADDVEGWALVFKVNKDGHHYLDDTGADVAQELMRGEVVFEAMD